MVGGAAAAFITGAVGTGADTISAKGSLSGASESALKRSLAAAAGAGVPTSVSRSAAGVAAGAGADARASQSMAAAAVAAVELAMEGCPDCVTEGATGGGASS